MRGRKPSFSLEVSDAQRATLQRWLRCPTQAAGLVRRARLILLLSAGQSVTAAAQTAGLSPNHARKWVRRFLNRGIDGLYDQPGRGRQPVFSPRGRLAFG
jgi:helix-turn-helix protein